MKAPGRLKTGIARLGTQIGWCPGVFAPGGVATPHPGGTVVLDQRPGMSQAANLSSPRTVGDASSIVYPSNVRSSCIILCQSQRWLRRHVLPPAAAQAGLNPWIGAHRTLRRPHFAAERPLVTSPAHPSPPRRPRDLRQQHDGTARQPRKRLISGARGAPYLSPPLAPQSGHRTNHVPHDRARGSARDTRQSAPPTQVGGCIGVVVEWSLVSARWFGN